METILVLINVESNGTISRLGLETLAAGLQLKNGLGDGSGLKVGLVGNNVSAAAELIGGCGADAYLAVQGEEYQQSRYATDVNAAAAIAREAQASVVLAPATSRMNRCLPGAAFRLDGACDTHITTLNANNGTLQVGRWYYRQRMQATLSRSQRPWFLLVEGGNAAAWEGAANPVEVKLLTPDVANTAGSTEVVGFKSPPVDEQTIRPDADLLFVAGAGWTKKQADGQSHVDQAEKLILGFLRAAKASLGGSKSLVDISGDGQAVLGFMTHLNQVGQTGSTPRHPKGLATCCHGEEPHVVGWRFVNERRAINMDANCGWAHGKADVLYVADCFDVMQKVNEKLEG